MWVEIKLPIRFKLEKKLDQDEISFVVIVKVLNLRLRVR